MNTVSYRIVGGDLEQAGSASMGLKERLKKIGAAPQAVRRAVIAAYEAETNVAIHATGGDMRISLSPDRIDVEVADEGPGIPDIDLAMKEGFSTAPARARELGFGAGMGLPNIRSNSDRFRIESTVGQGTRVSFTIFVKPELAGEASPHSVRITAGACRECLACVRDCPTRALRIRGGNPVIRDHRCIDCGQCVAACRTGALGVMGDAELPPATEQTVLVLPTPLLVQFGARVCAQRVLDALADMGFRDVRVTHGWHRALRRAVVEFADRQDRPIPVISPVCPAVVNLIEMRFPSLIEYLAPFVSPMEAAQRECTSPNVVFVAACPAQRTALSGAPGSPSGLVVTASRLRRALAPLLAGRNGGTVDRTEPRSPNAEPTPAILQVSGVRHVINVLETLENGLLPDVRIVEPFVCDLGCFGSPLLVEDPFVARRRWEQTDWPVDARARAVRRDRPFEARSGLRLDEDMSRAVQKLGQIDALVRALPGRDCALCGAPTCAALAEDMVMGRATQADCVHQDDQAKEGGV